VLPVEAGGLNSQGALDAQQLDEVVDVAEERMPDAKTQLRERWYEDDEQRYERLMTTEMAETLPEGLKERQRITLKEAAEHTGHGDRYLILMTEPRHLILDHPEIAKIQQPLDYHLDLIAARMKYITRAIRLEKTETKIAEAIIIAARWHDRGKNRRIWQRYACNPDVAIPLAKSTKYLHGRYLGGYRHEFGSLIDAAADEKIRTHPEIDLILHLISAHHGWARPHFESNACDNTRTTAENEEAAAETMRRFARLQQRFGRWGLAWLESLVRCADIAASQYAGQSPAVSSERAVNQ
jgi:CRISPR-associated endonuclease/helicase Cas3